MGSNRYKPEEIVFKIHQVDVLSGQGGADLLPLASGVWRAEAGSGETPEA